MEKPKKLLTRRDVAAWLRIRPERVDVLIREHGFPVIFLPNRTRETVRFSRPSVEAWLRSREEYLPE
jgi:hypothetical protein